MTGCTMRSRREVYARYKRPPVTRCSICGRSLVCKTRYRVKLVLKNGPLAGTCLKTLHVCEECLEALKADKKLKAVFKLKYRRMPVLCP